MMALTMTIMTAMWGAMELYEAGQEMERKYIKGMRATPIDPEFTFIYFTSLIKESRQGKNVASKAF